MTALYASLPETKKILERLRSGKAEAVGIDAKETLNLKQSGDGASFIRHIAALANSGRKGYLIIGVENKTWIPKGLPNDSPLRDVDNTQQQMNQLLAQRIDPPVVVGYRTHEVDGLVIGVVGVEGENLPYVISISDTRYGGPKTEGKDSYVYKGVIYVRRGTDSVPAYRQVEVLEVVNGRPDYLEIAMALVFISVLVGIGVGVGSSLIRFPDPYTGALLGLIWGVVVGWILNKRLADPFGNLATGKVGRVIRNTGGLFWGGAMGAYLSYTIVDNIISGKTKILDPVSMAFLLAVIAILISLTTLGYAKLAQEFINKLRRGA